MTQKQPPWIASADSAAGRNDRADARTARRFAATLRRLLRALTDTPESWRTVTLKCVRRHRWITPLDSTKYAFGRRSFLRTRTLTKLMKSPIIGFPKGIRESHATRLISFGHACYRKSTAFHGANSLSLREIRVFLSHPRPMLPARSVCAKKRARVRQMGQELGISGSTQL